MTDDFNFGGNASPDPVQPPPSNDIPPVPQVPQVPSPQQQTSSAQDWLPPTPPQAPPPSYQAPQQQPYTPQQQPYTPPQQPYQVPSSQPYNYYQQQQPGYTPPYYPPPVSPSNSGDGMAVASLILGILSLVTCCVIYISLIFSILALVLGIVAKSKGAGGMAVAGIVLGSLGAVLSIALTLLVILSPEFAIEIERYGREYTMMALLRK